MAITKFNTSLTPSVDGKGNGTTTLVVLALITVGAYLAYEYVWKPYKAEKDAEKAKSNDGQDK